MYTAEPSVEDPRPPPVLDNCPPNRSSGLLFLARRPGGGGPSLPAFGSLVLILLLVLVSVV